MDRNLLRRARIRNVREGKVQQARAEALENDAKDDAERWQDYGFAAQPVDGQGLVINAGGHTVVLRLDRIGERPQLADYEVAVWHHEGHFVKLKAGKVVEVSCDHLDVTAAVGVHITTPSLVVDASSSVAMNTPMVTASTDVVVGSSLSAGDTVSAPTVAASTSLTVGGEEMHDHRHGDVASGTDTSGPPV